MHQKQHINGYDITIAKLSAYTDVTRFKNAEDLHIVEVKNGSIIFTHVLTSNMMEKVLQHPEYIKNYNNLTINPNYVCLMRKDFIHNLEKYGRLNTSNIEGLKDIPRWNDHVYQAPDIFAKVGDANYEFVQYVPNEHFKYSWRTSDGQLHMEPFILDDGYANINNEVYHLDDMVEYLSHRDDVAFLTYMGRWSDKPSTLLHCPLKGDEASIGGVISDIEYHLEDGEERPSATETINVLYYPDQGAIEKIIKWSQGVDGRSIESRKTEMYVIDRFVLQELLDCKQFLQYTPEPEIVVRKFKH